MSRLICWIDLIFWNKELLIAFGAQNELLTLAQRYLFPIQFVVPTFLFNQMFAAFLRNDGNPTLATKAVLFGGILNIFGDYFFVFTLNMGIFGAGLATALGSVCSLVVMLSHFFSSKNTLQFVWPSHLLEKLQKISIMGFSTFFTDVAMGLLTVLFNRQIMKYLGTNALAVYAVIINISTFVQCCAYSVGQAAQPIISSNFGAHQGSRIQETLKYALWTIAFFSLFWTGLSLLAPNLYIRIFMTPTPEVLAIAPSIIRTYALSFLLLPFNVFSTFYFQALMKPTTSFIVSVTRGAIISGILIYALPALFGANALWLAMPITELLVALYTGLAMIQVNQKLITIK